MRARLEARDSRKSPKILRWLNGRCSFRFDVDVISYHECREIPTMISTRLRSHGSAPSAEPAARRDDLREKRAWLPPLRPLGILDIREYDKRGGEASYKGGYRPRVPRGSRHSVYSGGRSARSASSGDNSGMIYCRVSRRRVLAVSARKLSDRQRIA